MSFEVTSRIDGPDVDESGALAGQADFAANRGTVGAVTNGSPESRAIIDGDDFYSAVLRHTSDVAVARRQGVGARRVRGRR